MIRAASAGLALLCAGLPARADLSLPPAATLAVSTEEAPASHRVATGPFRGTLPAIVAEGAVTRRVWRVPDAETSLALLAPLRAQLLEDGWEIVLDCTTRDCGGFDFRFEIDVTPAPDMFLDLADYRYLSARRGKAWTTLVVSLSAGIGYVQETRVDPSDVADTPASTGVGTGIGTEAGAETGATETAPTDTNLADTASPSAPIAGTDIARALDATGHAILPDLDFITGSTDLADGDYSSLDALATYMTDKPDVTVALVGHTDAVGGAAGNMAISRRRAESARRLLTTRYGIAAARVDVQGVGFYAPVASNATEDGRSANRRVEVVITSTD